MKSESAKPTPGPWRFVRRANQRGTKVIVVDTGRLAGGRWVPEDRYKTITPEHEANARLIAAAPELLAALRALYSEWNSRTTLVESCDFTPAEANAMQMAESAIAKTEGSL